MQGIFGMQESQSDDLPANEKLLFLSFNNIYKLYILLLLFLVELKKRAEREVESAKKKNFPTEEERNPSYKFVNNRIFKFFQDNLFLQEYAKNYKLDKWKRDPEFVVLVLQKIKSGKIYREYMQNNISSFKDDKEFVLELYKNHIAPEEKLHDSFESDESHWADDIATANTFVMKTISDIKELDTVHKEFFNLFKDEMDRDFAKELFRKVVLNDKELTEMLQGRTPNWEYDRISRIDRLILKMGIAEIIYFPSIPPNVTINEYVEIAKEYSTQKSNIFINGVLDKVLKDLKKDKKLNKNIRGNM